MFTGVGGFEIGIKRAVDYREFLSKQETEDLQEGSPNPKEGQTRVTCERTNDLSKTQGEEPRGNERDGSNIEQIRLASKQLTCVGFSEIDKYASELLAQKFPSVKNWGDCTKINPSELPDFDMLCGGFPCQSFSIAGKRRGFKDTRGTMFFEITRILEVKRPKIILLENVKGLLNHEEGKTFSVILETLDELGYETQWMVLNSKFFGVPQNRERVFIIGSLRGEPRPEILPFGEIDQKINRRSFEEPSTSAITSRYFKGGAGSHFLHNIYGGFGEETRITDISPTIRTPKGGGHLPMIVASRGRNPMNPSDRTVGSPTEQRLEVNSEGICNNLTSVQKDHMVLEKMKIRRLTPTECERLQSFPDGWTKEGFSDTQRYKMMGNAVTVNVVEAIMSRLLLSVETSEVKK